MSNTVALPRSSRRAAKWHFPSVSLRTANELARELGVQPLIGAVLLHRGLSDGAAARNFLEPSLHDLHAPASMRDMALAVERLTRAIKNKEPVLLYGDYDVDGTVSIVVLKKAIEILGGCAEFHVPHRLQEGYGMRAEVVERAAKSGVRLIVSVDTGIRAGQVVEQANALGMDVIVTDHHLPDGQLPPALAVLNPNRSDCSYPNKALCGAGVTLKLVQALLERSSLSESKKAALLDSFIKPVAIATVADMVPLTGENRVIVRRGLSGLRDVRNPGLKALLEVSGLAAGEAPSAYQVGFRIAPRINAAGRMASATDVIELFLTESADRARELASNLDDLNRERQHVESTIVEEILSQCEAEPFDESCAALVFSAPGWHLGVLGIVASRLVERFSRPVFVLSDSQLGDSGAPALTGSGRSIRSFHLLEALESMPDLFSKFGGHRQAAGLTLPSEALVEFRARFGEFAAARLSPEDLRPHYEVDAEASFAELNDTCVQQLFSLGPFGFGNPCPLLCARRVEVAGPPKILKEGKHLSVPLRHGGRMLFVKAWNFGDRQQLFTPGTRLDLLFQVEDDAYSKARGYGSWCLTLKDAQPS